MSDRTEPAARLSCRVFLFTAVVMLVLALPARLAFDAYISWLFVAASAVCVLIASVAALVYAMEPPRFTDVE